MHVAGNYAYLNGCTLRTEEARISLFDAGLLRGYAVFDLLQTVSGKPYMLAEHLQRFRNSADHLGLKIPATDLEIEAIIGDLLSQNGHAEATVRLVLTGGESPDGMHFDPDTPTFFIVTHELFQVPEVAYEKGGRLLTVQHCREFPEAKTTNYLTWLAHHHRIEEEGALDLLYHDGTTISEAATASVYVVRGSRIYAPAEGVLWGTVGAKVLDLAAEEYEIVRQPISLKQLLAADEVFLTSSVRDVVPITLIDEQPVGTGEVGPITRRLMELYRAHRDSHR
jgi:branched-chain amino acid aminotransferase